MLYLLVPFHLGKINALVASWMMMQVFSLCLNKKQMLFLLDHIVVVVVRGKKILGGEGLRLRKSHIVAIQVAIAWKKANGLFAPQKSRLENGSVCATYSQFIPNKMKPTPTDHDLISGGLIYGLDRTLCDSTKVPIGPPTPSFASSQMEGLIWANVRLLQEVVFSFWSAPPA